jgi:hypothetical protein
MINRPAPLALACGRYATTRRMLYEHPRGRYATASFALCANELIASKMQLVGKEKSHLL